MRSDFGSRLNGAGPIPNVQHEPEGSMATDLSTKSTTPTYFESPPTQSVNKRSGSLFPPCALTTSTNNTGFPAFVKPNYDHMTEQDLEYLTNKGAFWIPDGEVLTNLIDSYLECVQSSMPLLDKQCLLDVLDGRTTIARGHTQKGQIGMLLFQAILFAGSAVSLSITYHN